jgi:hypothetical protein
MDQFEADITALDLTLTPEHRARLDKVSEPRLNFPAGNNALLAPIAQNGGTTVNGVPTPLPPPSVSTGTAY